MEPTPPPQGPETKINDPDQTAEQTIVMDTLPTEQPLYRRAISKLMSPIVALQGSDERRIDAQYDLAHKEAAWDAASGVVGKTPSGQFAPDTLPSGRKEQRAAAKSALADRAISEENVAFFRLRRGTYKIDAETGLSSWRNQDGSMPAVDKKTRKFILEAEHEYKHLKEKIEARQIALWGADPDDPSKPARSDARLEADEEIAKLKAMKRGYSSLEDTFADEEKGISGVVSNVTAKDIREQEAAVRRAILKAGKHRQGANQAIRGKRMEERQEQVAADREAAHEALRQRQASVRQTGEVRKPKDDEDEDGEPKTSAPRRAARAVKRKASDHIQTTKIAHAEGQRGHNLGRAERIAGALALQAGQGIGKLQRKTNEHLENTRLAHEEGLEGDNLGEMEETVGKVAHKAGKAIGRAQRYKRNKAASYKAQQKINHGGVI